MQVRYAGCLLAALLLGACGGSTDKGASSFRGSQRLDITARDFALKINGGSSLRPGPVTIVARNSGKQAHGVVLVKLNDGVTTSALVSALKTTVKYALPRGAYIAYCSYATAASGGRRHAALGMITPFAVK